MSAAMIFRLIDIAGRAYTGRESLVSGLNEGRTHPWGQGGREPNFIRFPPQARKSIPFLMFNIDLHCRRRVKIGRPSRPGAPFV